MPSPGLVFAKRKKTPFRGPTLHTTSPIGLGGGGGGGSRSRDHSVGSRSQSQPRRRSGHIIEEEDEEEEEDGAEIEEVDTFSPLAANEVEDVVPGQADDGGKGQVSGLTPKRGRGDMLGHDWSLHVAS